MLSFNGYLLPETSTSRKLSRSSENTAQLLHLSLQPCMSYQLPPLSDEVEFEKLVRDILRRVYDDPGIERFGRRGQAQYGVDGFSPGNSTITFQCKLKDTRYSTDD